MIKFLASFAAGMTVSEILRGNYALTSEPLGWMLVIGFVAAAWIYD